MAMVLFNVKINNISRSGPINCKNVCCIESFAETDERPYYIIILIKTSSSIDITVITITVIITINISIEPHVCKESKKATNHFNISTSQQPQQSSSSTTQQTEQSGSGTATTISTASVPDYLGLYEMYEDTPATGKPRLLSRMNAASTSGFVGAEATGEIETGDDTDVEESSGLLKRVRTTETQSTASIRQTKKKSKTAPLLKQFQKKSKWIKCLLLSQILLCLVFQMELVGLTANR
ncbi:hypothetical protein MAM1_0079c04462 [Mucor ambiguus]|uniref:Uncharacterized protein n=1 Tax=Mucor ambiguus TaxID=91626 RepID=A0A0C9MCA5_9FUNG|nr:hypothetical protein MAM1_0079c04462 [Mucor ambiguus]